MMRDSWLDDALRSLDSPEPSKHFAARTLSALRARRDARRTRLRWSVFATSAATLGCALVLAWIPSERTTLVTEAEIAGLREEIHSLRAELPRAELEIDIGEDGELWVDMEALLSASAEADGGGALDTLFAVEGGQL